MKKANNSAQVSTADIGVTKIILGTIASTTLRVFAPTLSLFAVGAVIDFNFGYKPYGMFIGTALGIVIAAVLVYLQIRSISTDSRQQTVDSSKGGKK